MTTLHYIRYTFAAECVQIKELSTRYSEFISFPIEVWAEKTSYDQVPDTSEEVAEGEEPKMKTVTRTAMQWEVRGVFSRNSSDLLSAEIMPGRTCSLRPLTHESVSLL